MGAQKINFESLTSPQNMTAKDIYLLQFFVGYNAFFDTCIANCHTLEERVDTAIGLIVATCPDKTTQNNLFDEYVDYKNRGYGSTTAAAFTIGSMFNYINDTMQITDISGFTQPDGGYGGKPKVYYLMELDNLFERYKKDVVDMLPTPEQRIDAATALIIARFPGKDDRERMWQQYVEYGKSGKSQLNSSILSAASLFITVSKEFNLTSEAFMGF